MKARTLVAIVLFAALVQVGAWAQGKYAPKPDEDLYGTWINEQYPKNDIFHPQKVVNAADRYEVYLGIADSVSSESAKVEIDAKWTDSEGNAWYKTFATITAGIFKGNRWQAINKLSKSGTVWERQLNPIYTEDFSPNKYPTTIDPKDSGNYRILYRAENK